MVQASMGVEHVSPTPVRKQRDLLGKVSAREVRILAGRGGKVAGAERKRMDAAVAVQLVTAAGVGQDHEVARDIVARVIRLLAHLQGRSPVRVQANVTVEDQAVL